jgi:capsular exopolysaccharide synthesis family protein
MKNNVQHIENSTSPDNRSDKKSKTPVRFTFTASSISKVDTRCVGLVEPESYESGRYKTLRATLPVYEAGGKGKVIAITSPSAGDGKTLTSINIAGTYANNPDLRVLLIDIDLRRKHESLARYLGFPKSAKAGLSYVLKKPDAKGYPAFYLDKRPNLAVLPRGKQRQKDPYELLESARFGKLIEAARSYYHYVILDSPPILPVPDNSAISNWVDGFVMVVTANRTPREAVSEAMRTIPESKMLGLIMNECEPLTKRYHRYYGKYGDN